MKRKAAELETEAAEIGLLASGGNGTSQQVNTPTITTTTTDVCGSTPDPVKGGEKELGSQNDVEFNLEDEEALKSKGTPPASNWSASSKDSLQDQTDQSDTYISNYDETSGHEGDEPKKADLVMENNRVPALHKRKISQRQSKDKRRRSHEHKEKELGIQNDGEFNLGDEEALKSKGTPLAINLSAGSKDSLHDQTDQNYTYISNYDETRGHKRDELNEADLGMENKRVQRRSLPEKMSAFLDEFPGKCARLQSFESRSGDYSGRVILAEYFDTERRDRSSSRMPNPGIKRPPVTVIQTPPPPPPPTV
ncbi:hypothetical protein CIPAW_15G050100 [Carya illinoinensis]|uniref:Uncharacterized protein n=1 Tax=Carya illinoinensis TaxID=32201 RepID=A0A8T1N9F3_CARIL|nr:hypothetical protein CIPAW_15G050100 [Carya illinoinensis]KAG6674566.1 hypothetical protein I3842_15G049300 [Carya illinoinensis]